MQATTLPQMRGQGGRRKLSPETEAVMVADYYNKIGTVHEIAKRFGVSYQTVYNAVHRDRQRRLGAAS